MKSAEQFQQFYQTDLLPHLERLEEQRMGIYRKVVWTGLILLAVALVALLIDLGVAVITVVVGGFIYFLLYNRWTRGFVKDFKENIIRRIITFVDPGLSYHKKNCIPQSVYMSSGLFTTKPDRYSGEDLVKGKVDKTEIQFSELHTEYESVSTDDKGNSQHTWHTIFKGIYFVADFNKHFHGQTVVVPDMAERLLGRLGRALQSMSSRPGKLVHMDDVEFEKRFAIYATDEIEARYLLTPGLMARITEFARRTGHEVYISFVHANIHVAIPQSKDLFEPRLSRSLLEVTLAQEYLDDLMLVVGIVEDLNLNTRIWTKQ